MWLTLEKRAKLEGFEVLLNLAPASCLFRKKILSQHQSRYMKLEWSQLSLQDFQFSPFLSSQPHLDSVHCVQLRQNSKNEELWSLQSKKFEDLILPSRQYSGAEITFMVTSGSCVFIYMLAYFGTPGSILHCVISKVGSPKELQKTPDRALVYCINDATWYTLYGEFPWPGVLCLCSLNPPALFLPMGGPFLVRT